MQRATSVKECQSEYTCLAQCLDLFLSIFVHLCLLSAANVQCTLNNYFVSLVNADLERLAEITAKNHDGGNVALAPPMTASRCGLQVFVRENLLLLYVEERKTFKLDAILKPICHCRVRFGNAHVAIHVPVIIVCLST
jgi:hypothetical protein